MSADPSIARPPVFPSYVSVLPPQSITRLQCVARLTGVPHSGHRSRLARIYEQAGVKGEAGRDSGSSQASIRHRRVRRATEQVRGRPQSRQRRPSAMRIREVRPL